MPEQPDFLNPQENLISSAPKQEPLSLLKNEVEAEHAFVERIIPEVTRVNPQEDAEISAEYVSKRELIIKGIESDLAQTEFIESHGIERNEVKVHESTGELFVEINGRKYPVSIEELDAELVWGNYYKPAADLPPETFSKLKNTIIISEGRNKLRNLRNDEISRRARTSYLLEQSIANALHTKEIKKIADVPTLTDFGIIAEMMVREYLARNQNERFDIERPTPIDDYIFKFDFVLNQKTDEQKKYGVQVTVGKALKKIRGLDINSQRWQSVLEKMDIDDFQILAYPDKVTWFKKAFSEWLKRGQPPGGPEGMLDENLKQQMLADIERITVPKAAVEVVADFLGFSANRINFERRKLEILQGPERLNEIIALRSMIRSRKDLANPEEIINAIEPPFKEIVELFMNILRADIKHRERLGHLQDKPQTIRDALNIVKISREWLKRLPDVKAEIDRRVRRKFTY